MNGLIILLLLLLILLCIVGILMYMYQSNMISGRTLLMISLFLLTFLLVMLVIYITADEQAVVVNCYPSDNTALVPEIGTANDLAKLFQ